MKTNALVLLGVATVLRISLPCEATVIFSQDFSAAPNGPVSTYVNNGAPNSGQWDSISSGGANGTFSVQNGALNFTRAPATDNTSIPTFSRVTDFSPAPAALIYKFKVSVSGNSAAKTTAATWQVGQDFSAGLNDTQPSYHSRFAINLGATPGTFQFRDITPSENSATFSGSQVVTWVINNSGSTLSYLAPDGVTRSVGDDKWDLWVGTTEIFGERSASLATSSLTDLKFAFEKGVGTVTMDDFQIEAVPEPKHFACLFLTCLIAVLGIEAVRNRRALRS